MTSLQRGRRSLTRLALFLAANLMLAGPAVRADEVRVVSSGGFAAAYKALAPAFERATGHTLVSGWGPSMGETKNAIPQRLARQEPIDVVIMVGSALDQLVARGQLDGDTRRVLATSRIALAVRQGAPRPRIASVDELKDALLAAKSIAYSDSASGVYLSQVLFPRLGLTEALKGKARMIPAEPVGQVVARGDAELGFQQLSELQHIEGIEVVGLLPEAAQEVTAFSAAVVKGAAHAQAGQALIRFLASPEAAPIINGTGLTAAQR